MPAAPQIFTAPQTFTAPNSPVSFQTSQPVASFDRLAVNFDDVKQHVYPDHTLTSLASRPDARNHPGFEQRSDQTVRQIVPIELSSLEALRGQYASQKNLQPTILSLNREPAFSSKGHFSPANQSSPLHEESGSFLLPNIENLVARTYRF